MEYKFHVEGMTCGHCERAVTTSIMDVDDNATVNIDRAHNLVTVVSSLPANTLMQVITDEAGYSARLQTTS